jgi:hypothetical protein
MAPKRLPPAAYLRQCFDYDPTTGVLTWRARPLSDFPDEHTMSMWNTRYAGTIAGSAEIGRITVRLSNVQYGAHRIIWRMLHPRGRMPNEIDHRDLNKFNNRPGNLRAATRSQNMANTQIDHRRNTTGYKGVYKHSHKFKAQIGHKGHTRYLGLFNTAKAAHEAYCVAATRLKGEFARHE